MNIFQSFYFVCVQSSLHTYRLILQDNLSNPTVFGQRNNRISGRSCGVQLGYLFATPQLNVQDIKTSVGDYHGLNLQSLSLRSILWHSCFCSFCGNSDRGTIGFLEGLKDLEMIPVWVFVRFNSSLWVFDIRAFCNRQHHFILFDWNPFLYLC